MTKVVIVDDELHCSASLQMLLNGLDKKIEILKIFNNATLAKDYLMHHSFDLLFLDIEMPGLNGFELLSSLEEFKFDVVFTTAYNQYAIEAFNYGALNYLLKPIDAQELLACVNQWETKSGRYLQNSQFDFLMDLLRNNPKTKSKIALPTTYGLEFVEIDEIIRCQADSNYTNVFFKNAKPLLICRTLKEVENILSNNGFIRIHQSHLINPTFLKKFVRNDGGYVVMDDGEKISVSKGNKEKITTMFNQIDRGG